MTCFYLKKYILPHKPTTGQYRAVKSLDSSHVYFHILHHHLYKCHNFLKRRGINLRHYLLQANRSQVSYEPLSDTQLLEVNNQVRRYLDGSLDEIDIVNVRQIQSIFGTFKSMVSQMDSEVESRLRQKYTIIDRMDPNAVAAAQKVSSPCNDCRNSNFNRLLTLNNMSNICQCLQNSEL